MGNLSGVVKAGDGVGDSLSGGRSVYVPRLGTVIDVMGSCLRTCPRVSRTPQLITITNDLGAIIHDRPG